MLAIVMAMMLSGAPVATPPIEQKDQAFTPEERKQALEALQTIANTFGQKQAPAVQTQQGPPQKTMADVADKALDLSAKYIGQAAAIIEKAAPRVWGIMVKQQYAKAVGELVAPIIWMIIASLAGVFVRHFWKVDRDQKSVYYADGDTIAWRNVATLVLPAIICVIAGATFAYRLSDSAMYLINPEFYAIKDLVQILLHPGTL